VVMEVLTRDRIPQEYLAGEDTTAYFVNPGVIEGHPGWSLMYRNLTGLDFVPELWITHILLSIKTLLVRILNLDL
jgi:hypothetical protein